MADIEGAEIEVRIKRGQLRKDIEKEIKDPFKIVTQQAQSRFENFTLGIKQSLFGGVTGGGGGSGAAAGIAGLGGKMLGHLALIGIAVSAAAELLGGIKDQLEKSSPAFKGTMMIMEKAFTLFFKPFGDFLSSMLRPLAMVLLKFAIEWTKIAPGLLQFLTKDAIGVGKDIAGAGLDVAGEAAKGIVDILPGSEDQKTKTKQVIDETVENWKKTIQEFDPIKGIMEFVQTNVFGDNFKNGVQAVGQIISDGINSLSGWATEFVQDPLGTIGKNIQEIKTWWDDNIQPNIDSVWKWLGETWKSIKKEWDEKIQPHIDNVINWFGGIWKDIKTFWDNNIQPHIDSFFNLWKTFWDGITGWLNENQIWNTFKSAVFNFVNAFISAINGAIDWVKQISKGIVNLDSFKLTPLGSYQTGLDYVPKDGLYMLHKGEQVSSATNQQPDGLTMNNTFNINATVNSSYDVDSLADELAERMQDKLRTKLSYGRGYI